MTRVLGASALALLLLWASYAALKPFFTAPPVYDPVCTLKVCTIYAPHGPDGLARTIKFGEVRLDDCFSMPVKLSDVGAVLIQQGGLGRLECGQEEDTE